MLLRRLTVGGRSIGQIARLPVEELRRLVRQDEAAVQKLLAVEATAPEFAAASKAAAPEETARPGRTPTDAAHLEQCLEAVRDLDVERLRAALDGAYLAMGQIAVIERVVLPLMRAIGTRWREGKLRVAHEHLASAVVRTLLGNIGQDAGISTGAPLLLGATPSGQHHELGALIAVATAASEGWRSIYLGPDLPAEEIAAAARQKEASAVALSLVYPADDPRLPAELLRLRRMLPQDVAIFAGGSAAVSYEKALEACGARHFAEMQGFRRALEQLRTKRK